MFFSENTSQPCLLCPNTMNPTNDFQPANKLEALKKEVFMVLAQNPRSLEVSGVVNQNGHMSGSHVTTKGDSRPPPALTTRPAKLGRKMAFNRTKHCSSHFHLACSTHCFASCEDVRALSFQTVGRESVGLVCKKGCNFLKNVLPRCGMGSHRRTVVGVRSAQGPHHDTSRTTRSIQSY